MPSYFDSPPGYTPRNRRFVMQDDPRLQDAEAERARAAGLRTDARAQAAAARDTARTQAQVARDAARAGRGVVKAARGRDPRDEIDAPDMPDTEDTPDTRDTEDTGDLRDQVNEVTAGIKKVRPPAAAPIPDSAGGNRRNETLEGMSPEQKKRIWHPELFNPDGSEKVGATPILAGGARSTIPPYTGPGSGVVDAARTAADAARGLGDIDWTNPEARNAGIDTVRGLGDPIRAAAQSMAAANRTAAGIPGSEWDAGRAEGAAARADADAQRKAAWESADAQRTAAQASVPSQSSDTQVSQTNRAVNVQSDDDMTEEERRRRFLAGE